MPHTIYKLLEDRNSSYSMLVRHATELASLNLQLQKHLPASLGKHCQLANYRSNTLVIQSESAAWASKLRYLLPQLRRELKQYTSFSGLKDIHIKVASTATAPAEKPSPPRLSKQSAQLLEQAAASMSDPELGKALAQLARHKR
ncbi:MAG: DUF721 domain-containing protein [Gammaproteobacteria bacterium]|nr:DUF721 domain-containing protein [Gammaproteobacteria bacterium]